MVIINASMILSLLQCYIAELMAEAVVCLKRNNHNRTQEDIQQVSNTQKISHTLQLGVQN